jgi:hypothetical protein
MMIKSFMLMWRTVTALLRRAQARNHPDLLAAVASALLSVIPHDALGWFASSGFNSRFSNKMS